MRHSSMFPKESPMICMEKLDSKNLKKPRSGKEEISELKCGSLQKSSIKEEIKYTVLEEEKSVSTVREQEI